MLDPCFINAMKHGQGKISFGPRSPWAGDEYTQFKIIQIPWTRRLHLL